MNNKQKELKEGILEQLKYFTIEESELLKMRFGIGFHNPMTFQEIAELKNKNVSSTKKELKRIEKRLYEMLQKN